MREGSTDVPRTRGFTLVELMITVAIIGVLATLAGVGYARFIRTSKATEATAMIGKIKTAQEGWRSSKMQYLDVSTGNIDLYFPTTLPINGKAVWDMSTGCTADPCRGFRLLAVQPDEPVNYRYSTIAGNADGVARTIDGHTFPAANDPWFVVKARGDLDQNGVDALYWSSSWDTNVWSKNAYE